MYGSDDGTLSALPGVKRPAEGWDSLTDARSGEAPTFNGLVQAIVGEYGKPTDEVAEGVGPEIASWITPSGNIIAERTWPGELVTLTLTDPAVYRAWRSEVKAQQAREQRAANPLGG